MIHLIPSYAYWLRTRFLFASNLATSCALILHLFASPGSLSAQNLEHISTAGLEKLDLLPYLTLYEFESLSALEASMMSAESLKDGRPLSSFALGFSDQVQLLTFSLFNDLPAENYTLVLKNPNMNYSALYQGNADSGTQLIGESGDEIPFSARTFPSRNQVFHFRIPQGDTLTFYLALSKQHSSVKFPFRIVNKARYQLQELRLNILHGIYFGFMLFIAVYALILGISSKDRVLYIYSALTAVSTLYLLTITGYSFPLFYPEISTINNYVRTFLMLALIPLLSFFATHFLSIKEHSPLTFKIIVAHNFAILSLVLVYLFFYFGKLEVLVCFFKLTYSMIITLFVCIISFIIANYKKLPQVALVYLLAQGSFLLGSLLEISIEYGFINPNFFVTSPVLMGSFIEIGLFSAFLFNRIHQLNKQKLAYLNALNSRQNENIISFIKGAEKEREIIAGELHDNIGSDMALMRMGIEIKDKNSPLLAQFDAVFKKLRDLSHSMAPMQLNQRHFKENVLNLLAFYEHYFNSDVQIQEIPWLNEHQELQLFRIVQEAVKNAKQHSGASFVSITLATTLHEGARLVVEDNGIGLNPDDNHDGMGLRNIEARAQAINGELRLVQSAFGGTKMEVVFWKQ